MICWEWNERNTTMSFLRNHLEGFARRRDKIWLIPFGVAIVLWMFILTVF